LTIEGGTAIVLTYVLVSMGVIIAFLLAAFVIGWFIGRLRQRRREQSEKSNLPGSRGALAKGAHHPATGHPGGA
jgi:Flp pilus assembly protein TadB